MLSFKLGSSLFCWWLLMELTYAQEWNDSVNLANDILSGYDRRQRPIKDQSQILYVNVSFEILTIQDVDEVSEKFTVVGLLWVVWYDQILTWKPSDHGYIYSLIFPITDIWYPQLVLTNPFSKLESLGSDWMLTRVYSVGLVTFLPGNVFQSSCSMDVTSYPFDTQECSLIFSPLPYGSNEVILVPTHSEVQQSYYTENGEWDLEETTASRASVGGGDNVVFTFKLKRKPKFVIVNVILPILFMAAINLLVFILPSESGERVGYSVTVLLALAVFLTLVADNLPKTSEPMPILSNYLTVTLVLSVVMCIMTIISLTFYHKDEDTLPPKPLRMFAAVLLCHICHTRNKVMPEDTNIIKHDEGDLKKVHPFDDSKINNSGELNESTWKDFSRAFDYACLFIFIIATIAANSYYLSTLMNGEGISQRE